MDHLAPKILQLSDLVPASLDELLVESERLGYRLVRRLIDDWASGENRFQQSGEAFFAAFHGDRVVGVCGLNVDPYVADVRVGRVRHLYVLEAYRRRGIGRQLIARVVQAANNYFVRLRLRTESPAAAQFYEALGFYHSTREANTTHLLELR